LDSRLRGNDEKGVVSRLPSRYALRLSFGRGNDIIMGGMTERLKKQSGGFDMGYRNILNL
jgi:hypothetical protein